MKTCHICHGNGYLVTETVIQCYRCDSQGEIKDETHTETICRAVTGLLTTAIESDSTLRRLHNLSSVPKTSKTGA